MSSYFKGQLDDLMTTLYKTEPHFIRCVVPNTHKQPGGVEPGEGFNNQRKNTKNQIRGKLPKIILTLDT